MGATQGCSSIEKATASVLQATRPASKIVDAPVQNAKVNVSAARHRTIISLWAKCKNAVRELSRFQKFLRRHYSTPNQAFHMIFKNKECERIDGLDGEYVTRDDFMHLVEKAGFKGDSGALFVMLKDDAGDFVTLHSFLQRLKVCGNARGEKFFAVVKKAVTTAALVDKRVEEDADRPSFKDACNRTWRSTNEKETERPSSPERRVAKDRSRSPNHRSNTSASRRRKYVKVVDDLGRTSFQQIS